MALHVKTSGLYVAELLLKEITNGLHSLKMQVKNYHTGVIEYIIQ